MLLVMLQVAPVAVGVALMKDMLLLLAPAPAWLDTVLAVVAAARAVAAAFLRALIQLPLHVLYLLIHVRQPGTASC